MARVQKMSALERVLTVLERKIPDPTFVPPER